MKHNDAELVRQTLAGNQDAFSELVRRYQGLVFGLAYSLVGNVQDAEDLAQDAFLSAYTNLNQLREHQKFGSWLRQITANFCRAYQQRHSYEAKGVQLFDSTLSSSFARQVAQIAAPEPLPDEIVEQNERQARIRQVVDSLSENNRLAVVLFYMHDFSLREISHFLEISISAVKARLHKARKQLKERLLIMVENEFETIKPKEEFTNRVMLAMRGRVISKGDGSPIADAKVILDHQTHTFTDASGNYRIELESGQATSRTLWIQAKGYPTYLQRFHTHAEATQVVLDAALDAEATASVSGRLVNEDGEPIKGALTWIGGGAYGTLHERLMTDDNGYVRYDGLLPSTGRYSLSTKPSGYLRKDTGFTVYKPGHIKLGDIVLTKGKTISGRVMNPQGEPVSGAFVHASGYPQIGHVSDAEAQTDADGKYIVRGVKGAEDGAAYVIVLSKSYGMAVQRVNFGDADKLDGVDFQLEEGEKIAGIVTDDKGNPMKGLRVEVYSMNYQDSYYLGFRERLASQTDAKGRFCIEGLPKTAQKLSTQIYDANRDRFEHRPVEIEAGMTDIRCILKHSGYIAGKVIDAETEQPIPKFTIQHGYPKADSLEEIRRVNMYPSEHRTPKTVELHNAWVRWGDFRRATTYASADGEFAMSKFPANAKRCLLVTADGYVATEVGPVEATRQPDVSQLTIRMQRGKRIRGIVTDSQSGELIQGVWVTYFSSRQPYALDGELLPHRIPTLDRTLPQGGETVCTNEHGKYEITTAQACDNYLVVNAPGHISGTLYSSGPNNITYRLTHPLEYVPIVVGPVEVAGDDIFLPISFNLKKKSDSEVE